jgi:hypothetical protein
MTANVWHRAMRVHIALLLLVGLMALSPSHATAQLSIGLGSLAVNITSPQNGSTVSGTVPFSASITIIGALTVRDVVFKMDGVSIGVDTTAPYSIPWNTTTTTNGTHRLTATTRDVLGLVSSSSSVTVTVSNDATPPTVALTAPAAGATVSGSITVSASASDNVGVAGVQFKLDGANLGAEDTAAPYAVSWNTTAAANGSHTLTAVARDAAGNVTTSSGVAVTVDNGAPAITITAPASGTTISGSVTVRAEASDSSGIAGVQFTLDGANLGVEDTSAPYSVNWDTTTASNGSHTLSAVARDTTGQTKTAAGVVVTVANASDTVVRIEDQSPSITYVGSWSQGNTIRPWSGGTAALATAGPPTRATLTFTGTAVRWVGFQGPQTGIANVYLDGALVATVDTYAAAEVVGAVLYTTTGLASTTHTLAIESTGTKNAASTDIFVIVDAFDVTTSGGGEAGAGTDTTPPTIVVTAPAGGATVSGTITVTASASDASGIAGVQFQVDGANLGAEDTTAPYSIPWDTATTSDGSHALTAVARDAAGNVATAAPVAVTVSNGTGAPPSTVMTRFENTDPSIIFTQGSTAPPEWWQGSRSRGWSGETAAFNRSEGARASFTFTGSSVSWVSFRAPWSGIGRVFLDGAFAGEFDLYSPTEQQQARVYSASGLAAGTHTIVVEVTGRKNASATDNAVVVDAFDVGPAVPPTVIGTRIENSSSAIAFTAGWASAAVTNAAWSGGSAAASSTAGARATVTFTGTTVSLIGLRGPQTGIARVFLDGAFHALVDTYSPTEIQTVVFTDTNLAPGIHEMTIEVTGTRNAAASNHVIIVDAFDVRTRFEEVDPGVRYTGTWVSGDVSEAWSGTSANYGSGTAARSTATGAQAEFSFSGTSVTWIGYRGPLGGIARVFVDGSFVSEVDTYSPTTQARAPVFSAGGLAAGPHTLRIEVTGLKNVASGAAIVVVDAFDVTLASSVPVIRRFQQTAATYPTGVWVVENSTNYLYTGGTDATSSTAGSRAEFTFTGRSIRWIGQRAFDGGIARVSVDGVAVADIDTFAPVQEEFQAVMFSATGLTAGTHTLTIEVTGTKHRDSPGTKISVDAFDVWQ